MRQQRLRMRAPPLPPVDVRAHSRVHVSPCSLVSLLFVTPEFSSILQQTSRSPPPPRRMIPRRPPHLGQGGVNISRRQPPARVLMVCCEIC